MIVADVLTVALIIIGLWLAFPALALVSRALAPELVDRAREHAGARPWRSLGLGLALSIPAIAVVAVLGALPGIAKPLAVGLACAFYLFAFVGVAGLATHVGAGLGKDAGPLATLRGTVCLELSSSIPFMGWFLIGPAVLAIGFGAATTALVAGRTPAPAPAPVAPQAPAQALAGTPS